MPKSGIRRSVRVTMRASLLVTLLVTMRASLLMPLLPCLRMPPQPYACSMVEVLHYALSAAGTGPIDYHQAWQFQRELHARVVAGEHPGAVLLLEHLPVFTAGKRTDPLHRPLDGTPVVDVDRGGSITWHGPGQLVVYPILRLPKRVYVGDLVRRLERMTMAVCGDFGVETVPVTGRSGVWVPARDGIQERKICAIGLRVSQGVSMHGIALNCDADLSWFTRIVPCGIGDAGVTSLSQELGRTVTVSDVLPRVEERIAEFFDGWAASAVAETKSPTAAAS